MSTTWRITAQKLTSVIGPYAESLLTEMMCSKLFIGIDGLDLDHGLTNEYRHEAHLNQYMINAAQEVIVLIQPSSEREVSER